MPQPETTTPAPAYWLARALALHRAGTTVGTPHAARQLRLAAHSYNRVFHTGSALQQMQAARGLAALALRDRETTVAQDYIDLACTIEVTGRIAATPRAKTGFDIEL